MAATFLNILSFMIRGGKTPEDAYQELLNSGIPPKEAKAALLEHDKLAGVIRHLDDPPALRSGTIRQWYLGPDDSDRFWPSLKKHLRGQGWSDKAISSNDQASTKILSLMQPSGMARINTRGLVVGYVQSGKTANYTALLAKAADVGYRLFIVLSGIHNTLRSQTQRRLNKELVGLNTQYWATMTNTHQDFRAAAGVNTDAYLCDKSHMKILCVVKKNAHVLRRLKKWLEAGSELVLSDCPTLIIDDEADQAGLNTAKREGERSAINHLILEILKTLPKAAYVGYTATPFANVLIDPTSDDDLYPRDFIVELPRPDGYFGAETLFGRERLPTDEEDLVLQHGSSHNMIRTIPVDDIPLVRPKGASTRHSFAPPAIAPSLDDALRYFLVSSAARRVREKGRPTHESMLIHTTLYTDSHDALRSVVEEAWTGYGIALKRRKTQFLRALEILWEEELARVPAADFQHSPVTFAALEPHLESVQADAELITENGRSLERLTYDHGPRTQIAIGGNTLSRGLTLEGLSVSYFVRSATAYDTLLQMGRWFGYRFGYEDLPRVWMSEELQEAFFSLATVEAELRQDIRRYDAEGMTPEQFAVRIRCHPTLAVTSALKMKAAEECDISYANSTKQATVYEKDNIDILRTNINATEKLIASLGLPSAVLNSGRTVWADTDVSHLITFLETYEFHPNTYDLAGGALLSYIREEVRKNYLTKWTVVLAGTKSAPMGSRSFGGISTNLLNRSRQNLPGVKHAIIGTVTTQADLAIGLPLAPNGDFRRDEKGRIVTTRNIGDAPIMILYPISKNSDSKKANRTKLDAADDIVGVAFGFPKSPNISAAKYVRAPLPPVHVDEEDELPDDEADED